LAMNWTGASENGLDRYVIFFIYSCYQMSCLNILRNAKGWNEAKIMKGIGLYTMICFMGPIKLLRIPKASKYGKQTSFIASILMHLLVIAAIFTTPLMGNVTQPQVLFVTMHEAALTDAKPGSVASQPVHSPSKWIQENGHKPHAERSSIDQFEQNAGEPVIPPEKNLSDTESSKKERMSVTTLSVKGEVADKKAESSSLQAGQAGADVDSAKGDRTFNAGDVRFGERGAPSFMHQEVPVYPALARRLGKEGRVLLKLLIDAEGKLKHVEVVETAGYGFTEASLDAVKRSTYAPGFQNGSKVAMRVLLPVSFRMQ